MRQLRGVRANYFVAATEDGKIEPMAEVIISTVEPGYREGPEGEERYDVTHVLRFMATAKNLGAMAPSLIGIAEESAAILGEALSRTGSTAEAAEPKADDDVA